MALACARRLALLILLGVLSFAWNAAADPFDPVGRDWEGYADFIDLARAKLGDSLVVTTRIDFDQLRAEDSLVLVHPLGRLDEDSLASFLAAGGHLVLLDDF